MTIKLCGSPDRKDRVAVDTAVLGDSCAGGLRLYNAAISHIDCYMPRIYDDVTRLHIVIAYRIAPGCKRLGISWGINAKMLHDQMHKAGTVTTLRQAVSTPHIWISDKLAGIAYDGTSGYD